MSITRPQNDPDAALVATPSQTVGPFFAFGLTTNRTLGRMADPGAGGDRVHLRVRILDGAGAPVPDAVVELSHAGEGGRHVFGRLPTDAEGACVFETVRPSPGKAAPAEAAHINVCLFMRGLMRHLYTRIYFAGDPALPEDPVLSRLAGDRRQTLLAQQSPESPDTWVFDVRLQGDRETAFFDL